MDQERAYRHPAWHIISCRDPKDRRLPDCVSSAATLHLATALPSISTMRPKMNIFPAEINEDLQTAGVMRACKSSHASTASSGPTSTATPREHTHGTFPRWHAPTAHPRVTLFSSQN